MSSAMFGKGQRNSKMKENKGLSMGNRLGTKTTQSTTSKAFNNIRKAFSDNIANKISFMPKTDKSSIFAKNTISKGTYKSIDKKRCASVPTQENVSTHVTKIRSSSIASRISSSVFHIGKASEIPVNDESDSRPSSRRTTFDVPQTNQHEHGPLVNNVEKSARKKKVKYVESRLFSGKASQAAKSAVKQQPNRRESSGVAARQASMNANKTPVVNKSLASRRLSLSKSQSRFTKPAATPKPTQNSGKNVNSKALTALQKSAAAIADRRSTIGNMYSARNQLKTPGNRNNNKMSRITNIATTSQIKTNSVLRKTPIASSTLTQRSQPEVSKPAYENEAKANPTRAKKFVSSRYSQSTSVITTKNATKTQSDVRGQKNRSSIIAPANMRQTPNRQKSCGFQSTKSESKITRSAKKEQLRTKLDDWDKAKDKTPSRYRHCRCFDVPTNAVLTPTPCDVHTPEVPSVLCEVEVSMVVEGNLQHDEESASTDERKDTEEKIKNELSRINESLERGAPPVDLLGAVDDLLNDVKLANESAELWVCKARLHLLTGDNDQVMETFKVAFKCQAAPQDVLFDAMKDAMKKMNRTPTKPTKHTAPMTPPMPPPLETTFATPSMCMTPKRVQAENVFESSAIMYSVREKTPHLRRVHSAVHGLSTVASPYKIITPVRRSTRASLATIPELLREKDPVFSSISSLPDYVKDGGLFQENQSLLID